MAQPQANFTADPTSGCAPIRVVFTNTSTGATSYRWDLGNGTTSTARDPSTTYFTPGVYTVRLTAYNGTDSNVITRTNFIAVYAIPTVSFEGSPLAGCAPLPVRFTDNSTPGSGTLSNWQWDFGDGNISNQRNPTHIYRGGGLYKVTLTVRNSQGCSNSASRLDYVRVEDSLRAKFGFRVPTSCGVPVTVQFTDSSVGTNIRSWLWDFGDGNTSTARNPLYTYTRAGVFTVRLIITNAAGCSDTLVKTGAVNVGNFTADFALPGTQLCANQWYNFTNTSTFAPNLDSVRWSVNGGPPIRTLNLMYRFPAMGTYSIKMVAVAAGCRDSVTKSITVIGGPQANFTQGATTACRPPLTVTFNNTTVGGTVVRWDFGNGQVSSLPSPTITYDSYGIYDVSLIVRSANGCLDTLRKPGLVRIQQPQIREIKGLPWRGCFPHTHNFEAVVNTPDPVVSWFWDFGDGTTSTQQNPSHTYTQNGVYEVKVAVTTAQGCTDTLVSEIRGGSKPTANFRGEPLLICPEDIVSFTSLSTGTIDEWFWIFGDGGTSFDINPTHQYNDTGWMNVTLIVSHNGCGDTITRRSYLYVTPPIARFLDSADCSNQFERFFTENAIGATVWRWNFGDGNTSEERIVRHVYADTGRYVVQLEVTDGICTHRTSRPVFILDEKANIETTDSGSCTFTKMNFYARGPKTHPQYISKYEWQFNNGPVITTDTNWISQNYTQPQTVRVKLKITDLNGCTDSTVQDIPVRFYGPRANFGPNFQAICAGSTATFSDSSRADASNPIVRWTWDFGNGARQTFTAPPFEQVYPTPGFYDVKLIVQDANGCTDSILKRRAVGVYKPRAGFVSADTLVCVNSPVEFENQSTGNRLRYLWDFNNSRTDTATNPITRYPQVGRYTITLIATDSIGCRDTLVRPLYITVANARAQFSVSDTFTTCPPLVVNFTNESEYSQQYQWNFGNGNTSGLVSPTHTYTFPGVFTAKLIAIGNGGCRDSATRIIRIQGPQGDIRYGPLTGCPPLRVSFQSTAINTAFYTWDFSDGESDFTPNDNTTHDYLIPGTYVPRLILEDGLGCKLPVPGPDTIRVFGAKAFIAKLPRTDFCDTALISFFDSTITNDVVVRYRWRFGDGTESDQRNPQHFYARPGRYRVTFEVWTANNCYTADTLQVPIIIAAGPRVDFPAPPQACVPASLRFVGQWSNPDTSTVTWSWDFGNGLVSNQANPSVVNYLLPGDYNIRLIATNQYGCADTVAKMIRINDTPRVSASPFSYICFGQEASLQAAGALTYRWDAHPTLSCLTCDAPRARATAAQTIYRVTGTDANGCQSSDTVLVRVKFPGTLTHDPGDTICIGESVQLRAQGFEIVRWSPPTGLSNPNINNPVARPTTTTVYTVTGTDSLNCFTQTGQVPIVVYPIPQFDIIESVIRAEIGTQVTLHTTSSPDITRWRWTPPVGLSCNNCPEPVATVGGITMNYECLVSNDGGCTARDAVRLIPICVAENLFIPNTFSPNGDGRNDIFYPRGKGLATIKSMRIFNRWGEVMYERKDFALNDPTAGWDGTNKGVRLTPDVYVYIMEVLCANNEIFNVKGNVTLLR